MNNKKDWGEINTGVAIGSLFAAFFCAFFPILYGTSIIFIAIGIIALWFAILSE